MSVLVNMEGVILDEISLVPAGMNEHADAPVAKAAEGGGTTEKRLAALLTSEVEGHQHGIHVRKWSDEAEVEINMSHAVGDGGEGWHEHEMVKNADGSFTVGTAAGHTHEVDGSGILAAAQAAAQPAMKGDAEMGDEVTKEEEVSLSDIAKLIKGVSETVTTLGQRQDRTDQILALSASERAVYDQLDKEAQGTFLDADADARKRLVLQADKAKAEKALADQPVFTSAAGVDYGKEDDPRLVALAKERDEMRQELQESTKAVTELAKSLRGEQLKTRAADVLSFAPGKPEVKAAVLAKIDELADADPEVGKAAMEMLKGLNDAGVYNWSMQGSEALNGVGSGSDLMKQVAEQQLMAKGVITEPLMELRKMADEYQAANPVAKDGSPLTSAKAYQIQSQTAKGRELVMQHYSQMPTEVQ